MATKSAMALRNLVTISRFPIVETRQIKHDYVQPPLYSMVNADPSTGPQPVKWERPVLYTGIELPTEEKHILRLVNLHLKSKLATNIPGGKVEGERFQWKNSRAWSEGFTLSSMKRMLQGMEVRHFVDEMFDEDERALIAVAGDFNADPHEVATRTIKGLVSDTGNQELAERELLPMEANVAEGNRYTHLYNEFRHLLDHFLGSRQLLAWFDHAEIHNEWLKNESLAYAFDSKFPEPDHAPMVVELILPDGTPIRLATFNIENWDDGNEYLSLERRIEITRPLIERLRADVICFQEVHGQGKTGRKTLRAFKQLLKGTRYEKYNVAHTVAE